MRTVHEDGSTVVAACAVRNPAADMHFDHAENRPTVADHDPRRALEGACTQPRDKPGDDSSLLLLCLTERYPAQAMSGTLTTCGDGPGTGASSFTLELPINTPESIR